MTTKALKIIAGPFDQLQPALNHLASVARRARGVIHKAAPVFDIPRLYEMQAMDSNAMGFIAIPKEYQTHFKGNRLTLKGFGVFDYELSPGTRLLKAKGLLMRDKHWCVEFETESDVIAPGPKELVARLLPNAAQKQQLHEVFNDMILWQKYFRDWRRIPPYRKSLPAWAIKPMYRETYRILPTTYWAVVNMANTRAHPKGIQHLEVLHPRYSSDNVWVEGVDGAIPMSLPAGASFAGLRIEYCKQEDVFTATFRRT